MNLYLIKARKYVLISCLAFIGTALFAQNNERITIKSNNITLKKALTEIENQSKLSVVTCTPKVRQKTFGVLLCLKSTGNMAMQND